MFAAIIIGDFQFTKPQTKTKKKPQNMSLPLAASTVTPPSGNGVSIHRLGFGTFNTGDSTEASVLAAIKAGFRTIDCSPAYENEVQVGAAIVQAIGSGVVKRDELCVISKLWPTHANPNRVRAGVKATVNDMQCGSLDVLLLHWAA